MNDTQLDDLQMLIDYNWADEERDFREHPGETECHIFPVLQRLQTYINTTLEQKGKMP